MKSAPPGSTSTQRRAYLQDNRQALLGEQVVAILEVWSEQDPAAAQHLALLRLAVHVAVPDLFDAVADAGDAIDLVNDVIVRAEVELVALILVACPALERTEFYGPAFTAVALALADRRDEAAEVMGQAGGGPTQRRALAGRLRRLIAARPELDGRIAALAAALEG